MKIRIGVVLLLRLTAALPCAADLTATASGDTNYGGLDTPGYAYEYPLGFINSCTGPSWCGYPDFTVIPHVGVASAWTAFAAYANYGLLTTGFAYSIQWSDVVGPLHLGGSEMHLKSSAAWNDMVTFTGSGPGMVELTFDYQIVGNYTGYSGQGASLPEGFSVTVGNHTDSHLIEAFTTLCNSNVNCPFSLFFPITFGTPLAFDASIQEVGTLYPDEFDKTTEAGAASVFLESIHEFNGDMNPIPLSYTSANEATYGTPEPATGPTVGIIIMVLLFAPKHLLAYAFRGASRTC
jgi:hypothetical protein